MILAWEEREAADDVPVIVEPRNDLHPLLFSHRYRRGRIVLGEIHFDHLPVFELLQRSKVVFEDRARRSLDRKFEYEGCRLVLVLPDFRVRMHALIAHHSVERVGGGDTDTADVILRVTRMYPARAVERLGNGARRLYAGDRCRSIHAESFCIRSVGFDGNRAHPLHHFRVTHRRRIPLAGDRYAKETLRTAVRRPLLRNVVEIRERRLVGPKEGRELGLEKQRLFRVARTGDDLGEIAELFRLKDYLAALQIINIRHLRFATARRRQKSTNKEIVELVYRPVVDIGASSALH